MTITIYHNAACSKSRKTLELIESRGIQPTVVAYLSEPPDAATLHRLADLLQVPMEDMLRKSEPDYSAAADSVPLHDEELLATWLHEHPRVLQRPIVVNETTGKAVLGRPPEAVFDILDDD